MFSLLSRIISVNKAKNPILRSPGIEIESLDFSIGGSSQKSYSKLACVGISSLICGSQARAMKLNEFLKMKEVRHQGNIKASVVHVLLQVNLLRSGLMEAILRVLPKRLRRWLCVSSLMQCCFKVFRLCLF
jgi:hypothetical protein